MAAEGAAPAAQAVDVPPAVRPLTDADLRRYIESNGLKAELLARPPDLPDADVIKSLVFSADGQPVLVVCGLASKVDERKLARHLGLSRRRVRLASTDDALQHSGYAVGTVPPFGHRHPLRTLLDAGVTRHPGPALWAGGGHPDVELRVQVTELLAHTRPEVGDFTAGDGNSSLSSIGSVSSAGSSMESGEWEGGAGGGGLPLPWPAGSDVVRLVGVVALRRRIAKTLLFATLVPESVPPLPKDGQAAYLRRLWRNPGDGSPCEVQLIVGKTLERALGREGAVRLMDSAKVGCVVAVTGRVQAHPGSRSGGGGEGGEGGRVLDVVVHSLEVLHKNTDALATALHKAARGAGAAVGSAAELERLRWLGPEGYAAAYARGAPAGGGGGGGGGGGSGSDSEAPGRERRRAPEAAGPAGTSPAGQAVPAGTTPYGGGGEAAAAAAAAAADGSAGPQYWRMPILMDRVHDVTDLAGVRLARDAILEAVAQDRATRGVGDRNGDGSSGGSAGGGGGGSAGGGVPGVVVGLDVEWRPFDRGQPATPAALLQLALRDRVFLFDLLALCRQARATPGAPAPQQHEGAGAAAGAAPAPGGCGAGSIETEAALSALLLDVFGSDDIIKVGFFLKQDLDRVCSSYPWLPLFAPAGGVGVSGGGGGGAGAGAPLRMHVDLLPLARALLPRMSTLAAVSLTRLTELLLGAPLDKAQQRSDWEARPLAGAQRAYAAADAAVLVALFDELLARSGGRARRALLGTLDGGLRALPAAAAAATPDGAGAAQRRP